MRKPRIVRQRQPREECPAFLAFVRRKPCCACGAPPPSQAAHLRFTNAEHPEKRPVGVGEKPSDRWANPLCASCHLDAPDAQHAVGEHKFWTRVGVDPFDNAARLWAQFERRRKRTPEQRKRVAKRAARVKPFGGSLSVGMRVTGGPFKSSGRIVAVSRPIRSANRWPPKGSRKINSKRPR